jgi:hypothetical protein
MTMRVLRFLRPVRSSASALQSSSSGEAVGLDAFATEAARPAAAARPAGDVDRLRIALIALGVLVVLEAVPTLLWVRSRLAPAPVVTVAAAPSVPASIPIGAASATPPCTPPAAQSGTAVAAATTRPDESAKVPAPRAAPPGMVAGLVAITAPVPMHVFAGGRLVGTTEADTIMLPVGEHDLELVSESIGLRARRTVTIQAGRTIDLRIDPPRVPVHVNAIPWAEVWIDNQRIGETPIGNLQQTVGSHEIVFRHPELGERRMIVMITMKEPARISMDLRKR